MPLNKKTWRRGLGPLGACERVVQQLGRDGGSLLGGGGASLWGSNDEVTSCSLDSLGMA